MEGKKLALVVLMVMTIFTCSLAQDALNDDKRQFEKNENKEYIQLFSDGSNDKGVRYKDDYSRKMMKEAPTPTPTPPPPPICFGNFCGGGLLDCDEPCFCNIPMGATRGNCVLY
ncbi:hypothetical protein Csa_002402 [Cucumis sativus]|uniref:Uncharacterized protein n=1 Tax=Cucumis sativus TaxID=3659 RepID=A0A0A0LGQ3_CUCSA|nr:hypothetical protein Csa_002402 [Cucumis sativus]